MGLGDNLMATGFARGARARGKRIAFGDGHRIIWDHHSETIFRGNPNIARPGSERDPDLQWVRFHRGHRLYNVHDKVKNRWVWNMRFRPTPGEVFFTSDERAAGEKAGRGFVVIEPNVERFKPSAPNKDWGAERYQAVADALMASGHRVVQFLRPGAGGALSGVERVATKDFRIALAVLGHAALYVGPEGGMHHGAAALGIPGVVLFGGFIPPQVTGYPTHANLTGGAQACGSLTPCRHCREAMDAISVDEVVEAARERLKVAA